MAVSDQPFEPAILEEEARGLWRARQLPPAGGALGPRDAPEVLQFEGTFTSGDPETLVVQRAVAADVDARYLALAGRRATGTLRYEATASSGAGPPGIGPLLERLGVWTGGDGTAGWDDKPRHARVEALVGRLAHQGALVCRDLPLRACPACGEPRSPERIIYQEEEGDAYLVEFGVPLDGRPVRALVWVDAPWRLLGTSALLVNPTATYVVARYRRGERVTEVLTSRSSLDRLQEWVPRSTFEIVEERPGKSLDGLAYEYPLTHEFPTGGTLDPPSGTILAVADVTDTGTGIVTLVPGHGSTDAEIAESRGVAGWPLVTPRGLLDPTLMHKYAGLDLATGSDFILRDLDESESIFARLRVRRGVPHCSVCGSAIVWVPGRAWCLEPGRLPPERLAAYSRILPGAPPLDRIEVAPWPVSQSSRTSDEDAIALLECSRCERLDTLGGASKCRCGGPRYPVRRRLIPSAAGAFAAWARPEPFPSPATVRLFVGERRRVPTVVHHLMGSAGVDADLTDLGVSILATIPDQPLDELVKANGADAVRAAFVRTGALGRSTGGFPEACRAERGRLARLWSAAWAASAGLDPTTKANFAQPIAGALDELEREDRALLARWEKERVLVLAAYERHDAVTALRRLGRFQETDLALYRRWVHPRVALAGTPPTKRAALRTLVAVLREVASALAPITPHTSEAIVRRLTGGRSSLFEGTFAPSDRLLQDAELMAAWDRWSSIGATLAELRRSLHLAPSTVLPSAVLVAPDDETGDRLRSDLAVLGRLTRVSRIEVGSPREPWGGRQGKYRPVDSEIQRLYPSQATQISHLIARTPPRGPKGTGVAELTVVIQGAHVKIPPTMFEYVETLPTGYLPYPWSMGEMFVELPKEADAPAHPLPALSRDAFWLVRRIQHRLRLPPAGDPPAARVAVVAASDPLAAELRSQAEAIAACLGLDEVRVVDLAEERPASRWIGRTRTGASWWIDIPGLAPLPPRAKHRSVRARCQRIRQGSPPAGPPEVDYSADQLVEHWQAVRSLGAELDDLLELPVLGPTKVHRAWEAGFETLDAYRNASFEQLVELPGFGTAIAARLTSKFGRTPPTTTRARRPYSAPPSRAATFRPARTAGSSPDTPEAAPTTPPPLEATPLIPTAPEADLSPSLAAEGPRSEVVPTPGEESAAPLGSPAEAPALLDPAVPDSPGPVPIEGAEAPLALPPPVVFPVESEPSDSSTVAPTDAGPPVGPALEFPGEPEASPPDADAAPQASPDVPISEPIESEEPELGPETSVAPPETATEIQPEPIVAPVPFAAPEPEIGGPVGTSPIEEASLSASDGPDSTPLPLEASEEPVAAPPEPTEPPHEEPPVPAEVPPSVEEAAPIPEAAPEPAPAGIELVVGSSPFTSIQPFLDATAAGHRGICLVRDSPERVAAQVRPRPVDVYWMTNLGRGKTVRPSDLAGIFALLDRSIGEEHVTALFLEGVEYLVRIHGIEELVGRLASLDERARAHDARVWVHLTPDLLRPVDLERITGQFGAGGPG